MWTVLLLLAGAITGLTVLVLLLYQRGSRARQQLAEESHQRAMAVSRRADHLQQQLDRLRLDQRIDRLGGWVRLAESRQVLPGPAAEGLHRHLAALADEVAAQDSSCA